MEVANTKTLTYFVVMLELLAKMKESGNQAVNGKAERMHHTVMNMARYMTVRVICLFLSESMQQNILFTV